MLDIDEIESDDPKPATPNKPSSDFTIFETLAMIGLAVWFIWAGWGYLRRHGWISQTRVTDVYFDGNWLTGEYRACETDGRANYVSCPKSGESQISLKLGEWNPRPFSVGFYGDIAANPEATLKWQCKREVDSITCGTAK